MYIIINQGCDGDFDEAIANVFRIDFETKLRLHPCSNYLTKIFFFSILLSILIRLLSLTFPFRHITIH